MGKVVIIFFLFGLTAILYKIFAGSEKNKEQYEEEKNEDKKDVPKDPTNFNFPTTWDKTTNGIISTLHPSVRKNFANFVNALYLEGIKYRCYAGIRTFAESDKGYKAYKAGEGVKFAPAGLSYHNYGLAIDGVEIKDGKALWTYPNINKIEEIGKRYGLTSGRSFSDMPHMEYKGFGSVEKLLAQYNKEKPKNGFLSLA